MCPPRLFGRIAGCVVSGEIPGRESRVVDSVRDARFLNHNRRFLGSAAGCGLRQEIAPSTDGRLFMLQHRGVKACYRPGHYRMEARNRTPGPDLLSPEGSPPSQT
jgi:hypothetical protein